LRDTVLENFANLEERGRAGFAEHVRLNLRPGKDLGSSSYYARNSNIEIKRVRPTGHVSSIIEPMNSIL
jgi:hypothetical protein